MMLVQYELIKDYLKPVVGGNIIDASCGSGMFSRLFAKSGLFSQVVALDFSETMLQQCYDFIKQDNNFPQEYVLFSMTQPACLWHFRGKRFAIWLQLNNLFLLVT